LIDFLKTEKGSKTIVFFLTCASVEYFQTVLADILEEEKINVIGLHGKMKNPKRKKSFAAFTAMQEGVMLCTDLAARGLDVPDIDWIVQFDAPQDPSFFIHRVGRAARAGRNGKALVYLLPTEETYVDFLRVKQVPIQELVPAYAADTSNSSSSSSSSSSPSSTPALRDYRQVIKDMAMADRDVMERAQRAMVTYIRAYKEHKCSFIFVLKQLPLADVARGYGLLFFPKLPDLKHFKIDYDRCPVKPSAIKFKNKAREKRRLEDYAKKSEKRDLERQERERQEFEYKKQKAKQKPRRSKQKRAASEMADEWVSMQEEARLLKRLKKGAITQKQFDELMGEDDDL
jgi:ATP-dependent RNA helicase DDX55/SPB4